MINGIAVAPVKIYVKLSRNSIDGLFTIVNITGEQAAHNDTLFKRLPIASGQPGYAGTSNVKGKSPIPANKDLWLWLSPKQVGLKPGHRGIGEFWPISENVNDSRFISAGMYKGYPVVRGNIGWHLDNALKGSAGCVVQKYTLGTPTERKLATDTLAFFQKLRRSGFTHAPIRTFY
jgi:hypothetical protein